MATIRDPEEEGRELESAEAIGKVEWSMIAWGLDRVIDYVQQKPLSHPDRVHLASLSQVRNLAKRANNELEGEEG